MKGRKAVREQIVTGEVKVNGAVIREASFLVAPFDRVEWGNRLVQARSRRSLIVHKPLGVVSATIDAQHPTVVDLVDEPWARELHLAGRLDRFTSGLAILTNDSRLSERLTAPESGLGKRYLVGCDVPIEAEIVDAFGEGIWLPKEQVRTQPAQVELLSERQCLLTIYEGKHHQVKRMFARFGVRVVSLHRDSMGPLRLESTLQPGEWRPLREEEIKAVFTASSE